MLRDCEDMKVNIGLRTRFWRRFKNETPGMVFFSFTRMHQLTDTPSGLRNLGQQGVEVKLWQIFILRNRNNLLNTLSAYALDGGPGKDNAFEHERVSYRFLVRDWEKAVKPILLKHSIPFEISGNFKVDFFYRKETKKKVYLVEDDLDILFSLNVILEDAGYDVLLSHSAKPLMERELPETDLFILDKMMPDGDGLDICQHLRARAETKNTPVIMISAAHNFYTKAKAVGVNDILKKPLSMMDFLQMVSKYTQPVYS
jgi:CheY-like chemotaxis protein